MIQYNPQDWFTFIIRFHKADTVRKLLPMLVAMIIYTSLVTFLEKYVFHIDENNRLKNLTVMHSLLGFVISMLLVFRTNTAYDRWWEGRKLWGALVNNSRNLAMKLNALLPQDDKENRSFFRIVISGYAIALRKHLRSEQPDIETFDGNEHVWKHVQHASHVPNQTAALLINQLGKLNREGRITDQHLIYLNTEVMSFTDVCGACERIKNTPIPFSYNLFLKKFTFVYVMTLPFGFVLSLGWYSVAVVVFIFYVLASLELIAEEIEEPFGGDANDLPTERIAQTIQRNVEEILI